MSLLTPEYLTELLDLPSAALLITLVLGLALALTGWKWHRFWLTLSLSLVAGLVGMKQAATWGIQQPALAGGILAATAGCLALSLARVGLFLAYGLACWYIMQRLAPAYAIPAMCICVGGIFSVVFYRFSMALLTSAIGCLMMCYSGFAYCEQQKFFPVLNLIKEQALTVHAVWTGLTLLSSLLQLYFWRKTRKKKPAEYSLEELEAERRLGFPVRGRAA